MEKNLNRIINFFGSNFISSFPFNLQAFTCSKSTIETPGQCGKSIQSWTYFTYCSGVSSWIWTDECLLGSYTYASFQLSVTIPANIYLTIETFEKVVKYAQS